MKSPTGNRRRAGDLHAHAASASPSWMDLWGTLMIGCMASSMPVCTTSQRTTSVCICTTSVQGAFRRRPGQGKNEARKRARPIPKRDALLHVVFAMPDHVSPTLMKRPANKHVASPHGAWWSAHNTAPTLYKGGRRRSNNLAIGSARLIAE